MNTHLRTALLLILLFFAAWLPRVLALDEFVTTDERKWLARSANFYQAISHGDLANTFQREHPGVTVMWAGMLGFLDEYPNYANVSPGQFTWDREYFEAWLAEKPSISALDLLAAGRWWIALGVALAIALGFLPLRRLFGQAIAVLATLFIAWDPFSIALSRQLHPDGLVSSLTFLALITFLAWLYTGQQRRYLVWSGVVMGLAWLTKTPAIFLVPTGLLLVTLEWLRPLPPQPLTTSEPHSHTYRSPHPRTLWLGYLLWGVIATTTFVVLWPAMWVDPFGSLLRMVGEMSDYVERHTNVNFFMGQPSADPGLIFYPVSFLFRITPAVLIGLIASLPLALRRAVPFDRPVVRRAALALLLFAILFTAGMTIGAKKFDRYILPAHLACDVLAALGWVGIGAAILRKWRGQATLRAAAGVATAGLIALHALFSAIHFPYYLTYYNPLLGGSATAQRVLFVGWGEGLEQAAEWINQQPDAERLRAASWYYDGPFSYYFDGAAVNMGDGSPLFWLGVDYAVTYINQLQRQLPSPEAVTYFDRLTPVHTVSFRSLELAQIYDMRNMPPPDFLDLPTESAADFGGRLRLLAHELGQGSVAAGDHITATLYLQSMAEMDVNYNVLLRLVGQDGRELWRSEGWPWGAPTMDWPLAETRPDGHPIDVPADAAPGLYKFVLSFYDPATLEPLRVTTLDGASPPDDTARDLALLRVGPPPSIASPAEPPWSFGRIASLDGADMPATVSAGDQLALTLAWRSLDRTPSEYTVFVHVVGPDGQLVAQRDGPPMGGFAPTRIWRPGQTLLDEHLVPLPTDLAAGEYEVRVGLYAQDGSRLPVTLGDAPAGDYAVLGAVQVENPGK